MQPGDTDNSLHAVRRLYTHMALGFSTLVLVLMLVVALAGTGYYRRTMARNNAELEAILTGILADAINRVSFSGKYHAQLLVEEIMKSQPRLSYIFITGLDDRIFVHSTAGCASGLTEPRRSIAHEVIASGRAVSRNVVCNGRQIREIAVPFRSGYRHDVTGVIFVGISTEAMAREIFFSHLQIISLIGILTLVSLLGTYVLCRYFVAPVKAMALQLKGILDFAPLLICITDRNGRALQGSEQYFQITGRSEHDFLADELHQVYSGREIIRSELTQWVGWHEEHFLTTSFPICHDRAGEVLQACSIALDVTEQKVTLEALKDSENRYRNLFDKSSDAMMLIDGDKFSACNDTAVRIFGAESSADIIGKTPFDLSPEMQSDRQPSSLRAFEYINRAREDGYYSFEWLHRRCNGEIFPAEVSLTAMQRGSHCQLHVILRDITERKNAEKALCEQEENLRITLDSIGDAVIATDRDGVVVRINPVAEKITGWSREEAEGKPFRDLFHLVDAEDGTELPDPVAQVLSSGANLTPAENTALVSRDGARRLVADSGAPIRSENGEIVGVVLVFRDITEQHKIEEQLRQSRKMDSIGQLAGGIAHDFNNMLSGIMGAANLLSHRLKDQPKLKASSDLILDATLRASELTRKLLDFSRKGKILSTPVSVHQIVSDTVELLRRSIDKRVTLVTNLNAASDVVIGDPAQLQNALLNLALNSRDAMPEGGTITITTANLYFDQDFRHAHGIDLPSGNGIEIDVADTGSGMTREVMSHVFEPFFTTKPPGRGTGLGLSSVYGCIMAHHGHISCYSEPGQGTVFKLFLPSEFTALPAAGVDTADSGAMIAGHGRIMVVDDESLVRNMARDILLELGYEPVLAAGSEEALSLYVREKDTVDLVLLDMVMPGMSGRELYFKLKEINPKVKVVFSSGFTRDHSFDDLIGDGNVMGYLQKPYLIIDLSRTVMNALQTPPPPES